MTAMAMLAAAKDLNLIIVAAIGATFTAAISTPTQNFLYLLVCYYDLTQMLINMLPHRPY